MTARGLWHGKKMVTETAVVCCLSVIAGCGHGPGRALKKYHDSRMTIGTSVQVDVCAPSSQDSALQEAMARVWNRFDEINQRMNAYDPQSDIGRVNQSGGQAVAVHPDVCHVVKQAVAFSRVTGGLFDVTVRPLIEVWRQAAKEGRLPLTDELLQARERIGSGRIEIVEGDDCLIRCDSCRLDLGGIAKGYAVDEAARILREHQFQDFLINAGGDLYAGGKACEGRPWRVGVRNPFLRGQMIEVVEISDEAVTTSGDYEQFYEIEGKRFSHIVNPLTGQPQAGAVSVTVIAPTAIEADVFSTALMVEKPLSAVEFINSKGPAYAVMMITKDDNGIAGRHVSTAYPQRKGKPGLNISDINK